MMKSEDDLIQQSLKLITQNKVFEQWRSELLFYLSESNFINEQRQNVKSYVESSKALEEIYKANVELDYDELKNLMVNKLKDDLLRSGLNEIFEKAVEEAIENQTVHWKNKIKEHVGATIKSQRATHAKDLANEYNRSLYMKYNDDRSYSHKKRWNY